MPGRLVAFDPHLGHLDRVADIHPERQVGGVVPDRDDLRRDFGFAVAAGDQLILRLDGDLVRAVSIDQSTVRDLQLDSIGIGDEPDLPQNDARLGGNAEDQREVAAVAPLLDA